MTSASTRRHLCTRGCGCIPVSPGLVRYEERCQTRRCVVAVIRGSVDAALIGSCEVIHSPYITVAVCIAIKEIIRRIAQGESVHDQVPFAAALYRNAIG